MSPSRVLVTGAGGFIGSAFARLARARGFDVVAAARRPSSRDQSASPDMAADADWRPLLNGVDSIVHCAARVHVLRDAAADPLAAFRTVNTEGTLRLARQAADGGIRRLVFVSTIGVNGAETFGQPFRAADEAAPHSPYAVSKHEAEKGLRRIARDSSLEVTIVRPPLVYGPGAPGNFGRLMQALARGLPLPFGAVRNRRSLVALGNLTDLLLTCLERPQAAGCTFLVSDGEDLSTPDLLRRTARALGTRARLLPVPAGLLRSLANAAGRGALAQQLCGSLQVDIAPTCERLGWMPPASVDEQLALTARAFLDRAASAERGR